MVPFGLWMDIEWVVGWMLLMGSIVVKKWPVAPVSAQASISCGEVQLVGAPDKWELACTVESHIVIGLPLLLIPFVSGSPDHQLLVFALVVVVLLLVLQPGV